MNTSVSDVAFDFVFTLTQTVSKIKCIAGSTLLVPFLTASKTNKIQD